MKQEILEAARRCLLAKHIGCKGCPLCSLNERTSSNCVDFILENFLDHHNKYRWHDLRKDPADLPPNEYEVDIAYIECDKKTYTARAIYEDGNVHSDNSILWEDFSDWCDWCEDTEDWIIPKCWLEYTSFGDTFIQIFSEVIAWREIEPFKSEDSDG